MIKNKILLKNIDVILFSLISIIIWGFVTYNSSRADVIEHIQHIKKINLNVMDYPGNFLFYFVVNFFSGFRNENLLFTTTIVLAASQVAKFVISKFIIKELNTSYLAATDVKIKNKLSLLVWGLVFSFAIQDPYSYIKLNNMYVGKYVGNVWHNSTVVMVFPFSLLLFWKQIKSFNNEIKINDILVLNALVLINIAIKPSFIFVYLPVTAIFILRQFHKSTFKELAIRFSPLLTGALGIILQYIIIYIFEIGSYNKEPSGVTFSEPFEFARFFLPIEYIPFSFLFSFLLPIFALILNKELLKYRPFVYSIWLLLCSVLISAFIIESGPRKFHGNFAWQNVICTYLLFLSVISFLLPKFIQNQRMSRKDLFLLLLFGMHVLSGLLYLIRFFVTDNIY